MTLPPAAEINILGLEEEERVVSWRFQQLLTAGYSIEDAEILAVMAVDLHKACDLAGIAGPQLAIRILS